MTCRFDAGKMGDNLLDYWNMVNKPGLRSRGSEVQILSGTPTYLINFTRENPRKRHSFQSLYFAENHGKTRQITAVDVGKMGEPVSVSSIGSRWIVIDGSALGTFTGLPVVIQVPTLPRRESIHNQTNLQISGGQ